MKGQTAINAVAIGAGVGIVSALFVPAFTLPLLVTGTIGTVSIVTGAVGMARGTNALTETVHIPYATGKVAATTLWGAVKEGWNSTRKACAKVE